MDVLSSREWTTLSHTGTASLTVPRSVSTGFVNHARLTDQYAAQSSARVRKLPCFRAHRRRFDSSIPRNDGVACFWLRKKKKIKEERKKEKDSRSLQLVSNHGWKNEGWRMVGIFCAIYIIFRVSRKRIDYRILWSCKVVVEEEDNAVANYSFRFLVPWLKSEAFNRSLFMQI